MKVLVITNMIPTINSPYFGIYVKEQFEYLKKNYNIDIQLFVSKGNVFNKYFNPIFLHKRIKMFKPDILHIHYGLTAIPLLILKPFLKKINIVTTYHGSDINGNNISKFISKLICRISDVNIAVSQQIFNEIKDVSKKTLWIPCGVDDGFLNPTTNTPRTNTLIFPGSPSRPVKNYTLFKQILIVLNNNYNIKPEVILFGSKSRDEVKTALNKSKCLVMTSLSEGSPQVIKEAIACNIPIVSTDVGDVSFLLKDLDNCYICKSDNEFAAKIALILKKEIINEYPINIKEPLTNFHVCQTIMKVYEELLN